MCYLMLNCNSGNSVRGEDVPYETRENERYRCIGSKKQRKRTNPKSHSLESLSELRRL